MTWHLVQNCSIFSANILDILQSCSKPGRGKHNFTLLWHQHYNDVIMSLMVSEITSLMIIYSAVYSRRSKKTWKLRVSGLCVGNSPVTCEFPTQRVSNAENVSIWWCHHEISIMASQITGHSTVYKNLLRLSEMKQSKCCISGLFGWESSVNQWISLAKD